MGFGLGNFLNTDPTPTPGNPAVLTEGGPGNLYFIINSLDHWTFIPESNNCSNVNATERKPHILLSRRKKGPDIWHDKMWVWALTPPVAGRHVVLGKACYGVSFSSPGNWGPKSCRSHGWKCFANQRVLSRDWVSSRGAGSTVALGFKPTTVKCWCGTQPSLRVRKGTSHCLPTSLWCRAFRPLPHFTPPLLITRPHPCSLNY